MPSRSAHERQHLDIEAAAGSHDAPSLFEACGVTSRRAFMLAAAVFAAGCATRPQVTALPEPEWPTAPPPSTARGGILAPPSSSPASPAPTTPVSPVMRGVTPRTAWAGAAPAPALMNKMLPVKSITIHHDGMTPFVATDQASTAARIERIRLAHRNRPDPWGDIGYHFVIDRAGRVWEGRPLMYQGAHVKNRNEGNVGILCLGNFEAQAPTDAQLRALAAHVRTVRLTYSVPVASVRTHKEWPGASTLCPGRNLQGRVVAMRSSQAFA